MPILQCRDVTLHYGDQPVLDQVSVAIESNERICLLGRNGTGKSTLLKVLTGEVTPESGEVIRQSGMRIATLVQAVPENQDKTIFEVIAEGVRLEALDDSTKEYWQARNQVDTIITRMELNPDLMFGGLSGGMKRRVLLAQAIVQNPDVLILDEPTNHLDVEAIEWLEQFLLSYKKAILFVSHDRSFVKKIATRIFDLDRGILSIFNGTYDQYLVHKAEALHSEAKEWERFDKKLAQEEIWIRQGIKARRTRNEGRVTALEKMRRERSQRRERVGTTDFKIDDGLRSGKVVLEAEHLQYGYENQPIANDVSLVLCRGDKIGIVGPNGCGKSTLIQLLLGELTPQSGTVKLGTSVAVAYLNQLRAGLNPESTLVDAVGDGANQISVNGVTKHVHGYLQDFLFTPARARAKVKTLSGGELNRLLLAKLFTKPANLLVLDEPTNDLDLETLELLEELLVNYQGTLILVSHDRTFLNNIVTSTLAFEGEGQWKEYVGGYDDYLRQRAATLKAPVESKKEMPAQTEMPVKKNKLSFKETRELQELPGKIAKTEAEIQQLQAQMVDPKFYQQSSADIATTKQQLEACEKTLETLFQRWEDLESK